MTDQPKDAKAIFLAAIERSSPEEQNAYLNEACAGDDQLRQRVEALIAAHREDSFLEESPVRIEAMIDRSSDVGEIQHTVDQDSAAEEADSLRGDSTQASPPRLTEGRGTIIGPYKLLQELGEGGMGTVYMAEQSEPVRRKVALKIIKPGMDSRQVIARFEAERQALALMDHQNISRVLDAGTTGTGRPYFVMELVNGVSA